VAAPQPLLTVVIPTIAARAHWLERCVASYRATSPSVELIVIPNDGRGVGEGWQEGADQASGEYLHLSNDDIEAHPGWWQAAVKTVKQQALPAPLILNTDGTVQSCGGSWERMEPDGQPTEFARVPFLSKAQWAKVGPMIPLHYATDNWVSHRGRLAGIGTVVCHGYLLTHHLAPEGRVDHRMGADVAAYKAAGGT
jgi:hypothetical protein